MKEKILTSILFLFVVISFAQKSVEMRLKPEVGSVHETEIVMDMDMSMYFQDQKIVTKMGMVFDVDYKTLGRKNDINDMEVVFERMKMTMSNPMMSGEYDSEKEIQTSPFAEKLNEAFEGVLGQSINAKVTTLGKMAEPLDLLKLFTDIPADKAEELQERMTNQFIHFPEEKVALGGSWGVKVPMAQVGEVEFTYTLEKINKKTLEVTVSGVTNSVESLEGVSVTDAVIGGDILLDRKTGETISSLINMDMKMKVSVQGQAMDMDMKSVIKMSSVN